MNNSYEESGTIDLKNGKVHISSGKSYIDISAYQISEDDEDILILNGTLNNAERICESYIYMIDLGDDGPEYKTTDEISYILSVSKASKQIKNIKFDMSEIAEYVWFGTVRNGLIVNSMSGSFYISYINIEGADSFEIPSNLIDASESDITSTESTIALPEKTLSWKDIYTSFLKKHTSEIVTCELAYLNDDDVPELFTSSDVHGAGAKVYTIKNEEVIKVGDEEYYGLYGSTCIYENTGIISVSGISGVGQYYDNCYKFSGDGTLEELCKRYVTGAGLPEKLRYYIDGVEISKEEFEAKGKELQPDNVEVRVIPVNGMTVDKMISSIANMQ